MNSATTYNSINPTISDLQLPVLFSRKYDPRIPGFDFESYGLNSNKRLTIKQLLKADLSLSDSHFIEPAPADAHTLRVVHSISYLGRLHSSSSEVAENFGISDLRKFNLPALTEGLLRPMQLATGGTLQAVDLAADHGWSINLSGGFHHAHFSKGGGYCFYNDLAMAALYARRKIADNQKVLIVDLDAHLGDGTATILKRNNRIVLLDIFNAEVWPARQSFKAKARIEYQRALDKGTGDDVYLDSVRKLLERAMQQHNIGFVIYNAGADIHKSDLKGKLNVSDAGVKKRDRFVFELAISQRIPVVILLAGAYGPEAPALIADSLATLIKSSAEYAALKSRVVRDLQQY